MLVSRVLFLLCIPPIIPVGTQDNLGSELERIVGGTQAQPHEFPAMVRVQIMKDGGGYICGGTLIALDTVLTAAHCVYYKKNYPWRYWEIRVIAGDHNIKDKDGMEQIRYAKSYTAHRAYDDATTLNDIALVHLSKPFNESATIRPIKLPSSSFVCKGSGTVVGWGDTIEGVSTSSPTKLRKVIVPVISDQRCRKQVENKQFPLLQNTKFCAGVKGKDSCQGDSGSSFMCSTHPNTIYGIVSYGYGCGQKGWPGVYTRVPAYINWIRKNMQGNGKNSVHIYSGRSR